MPACWRYERMRPEDLAEAVNSRPIAWLPIGPLEWHGEAVSFGCDPVYAAAVTERAWSLAGGVLMPTLYVGIETLFRGGNMEGFIDHWALENTSGEHHPGSVFCRSVTLELLMRDYLYFLQREGFKLCVLVSGHGGWEHLDVLSDLEDRWRNMPMRFLVWKGPESLCPEDLRFDGAGGHADFSEASVLGAIDPALVCSEKFGIARRDRAIGLKQENSSRIDYEKGRRLLEWEAGQMAAEIGKILNALLENGTERLDRTKATRKWYLR
ncbi:MAG: creatininase family protein [Bacillota bacterium]